MSIRSIIQFPAAFSIVAALALSGCGGSGGGGGTPPSASTGNTTNTSPGDGGTGTSEPDDRLLGVLWDDPDDSDNDLVPYVFEDTYDIPGVGADGRQSYIADVKRDADYALRSVQDIGILIDDIRGGIDHEPNYYDEEDPRFQRFEGQYGHEPGAEGSSLKDFVDAGSEGVIVLVGAQGVSMGIADAALDDIEGIRNAIEEIEKYRKKAVEARRALLAEADRLEDVEIVALVGPEADQNGGKRGDSLEEAQDFDKEAEDAEGEIVELRAENDALEALIIVFEDGRVPTTDECTSAADCQAKIEENTAEIADLENGIVDLRRQANDKRTEADEFLVQAIRLQEEADQLRDVDADEIQQEIGTLDDDRRALMAVLNGDDENQGDLASLRGFAGSDTDKDEMESNKAAAVHSYLKGTFTTRTLSESNQFTLLGRGANFAELVEREEDDPNSVFARAPKPEGTMDAWQALGDGVVERSIKVPGTNDPDHSNLDALQDQIGEHRALLLADKPGTTDFSLKDPTNDKANFDDDTPNLGDYYEGRYKGVYGTLYYDSYPDKESGLSVGKWFFTPTTNVGTDQSDLRGEDTELYRYKDEDGDGVYDVVEYVDYGMWLEDVGTEEAPSLGLSLLVGLVGPDESGGLSEAAVDVTTESDDSSNRLAQAGMLPSGATYEGTAKGLSARQTGSRTASGHFEADVSLKATFGSGSAAMLGGHINNFRSADPAKQGTAHVNSDWEVTLSDSRLVPHLDNDRDGTNTDGGQVTNGGVAGDSVRVGSWAGTGYGSREPLSGEEQRPEGFYGGFRAEFTDGSAAGVFHAEQVE